jgi:putative adenylate-forming enzyme
MQHAARACHQCDSFFGDIVLAADLLRRYSMLRRHDHWPRSRLIAHQSRELASLRAHAYAHSSFYRRFHAGLESAPLRDLPVLSKTLLMEHFDEIVTDPTLRLRDLEQHLRTLEGDRRFRGYWVSATSGSTGRRGIFVFDRAEWMDFLASWLRGRGWTGRRLNLIGLRVALVVSRMPWHMSARVGASFARWVPTLCLDAGQPIAEIVHQLNEFQPRFLVAFPSIAEALAVEQSAGRLRIRPELVFTAAEVLSGRTRQQVERAWGKRLFDQYGATECGGLAAECEQHSGLHLFEDRVICEVLDADARPVSVGVYGDQLLLTVLGSRTLPLIRYELDDSVRVSKASCTCGRPYTLLDSIQGRADELLTYVDDAGGRAVITPIVFYRVMDLQPVQAWQVIQEGQALRVQICGPSAAFAPDSLRQIIHMALAQRGVQLRYVVVEEVPVTPRGMTGKSVRIRSRSSRPDATASTSEPFTVH